MPARLHHEQTSQERREIELLATELAARGVSGRPIAIVLGSGLGAVADRLKAGVQIDGHELEHLPRSRVRGHAGTISVGELGGVPVVVQSGRVHLYEGHSPFEVTRMVRALAHLGTRMLVLTNAAGGLVREWEAGTFMRITDHLNLQSQSPLFAGQGSRTSPYDDELGAELEHAAGELRIGLRSGVYAAMLGPAYETPAEIRALQALGAQAVGMSTVMEACAGRAADMRVVGLSCISNPAAGIGAAPLHHEDVLGVMRRASGKLGLLLERVAPAWERTLSS